MTTPDAGLNADALEAVYGKNQSGHPDFPSEDWRYEVANNDTRLGYWEWVVHKVEDAAADHDHNHGRFVLHAHDPQPVASSKEAASILKPLDQLQGLREAAARGLPTPTHKSNDPRH